ncbi:unnamed protein product [Caenorhabditis angaria]|uniref:Uncharacterized protein n=1 Tax=Caenorhabditis angaria TaxID=860376 RepID=A0A9P1IX71_9PELO|nr:unnamed protein product [Caenorhabditis angaria]
MENGQEVFENEPKCCTFDINESGELNICKMNQETFTYLFRGYELWTSNPERSSPFLSENRKNFAIIVSVSDPMNPTRPTTKIGMVFCHDIRFQAFLNYCRRLGLIS